VESHEGFLFKEVSSLEFLLGLALFLILMACIGYKFLLKTIMWVFEPMIKHFEEKEARRREFMDKIEKSLDKDE